VLEGYRCSVDKKRLLTPLMLRWWPWLTSPPPPTVTTIVELTYSGYVELESVDSTRMQAASRRLNCHWS